MLCDVQIQLSVVQPGFHHNLQTYQSDNENFNVVDVFFDHSNGVIRAEDTTPIALLNVKAYRALTSEIDPSLLSCIGLVRQKDLEQGLFNSTSLRVPRSQKPSCPMDVIICGPHYLRDKLSRNLSKSRLFLQRPRFIPDHRIYDNPHYLGLPGPDPMEGEALSSITKTTTPEGEKGKILSSESPESSQTIDAIDILSHITVQNDLQEVDMDKTLIRTALKPYQREGIDFILRRERPSPDDTNSLWRRHCSFESEPLSGIRYLHRISDTKSPIPRDPPGGILADDMGHGKTLTMICAIVRTLQQYDTYNKQLPSPKFKSDHGRNPSKSTLVVLPSVDRHVVEGKISYCKYHGRMRRLDDLTNSPHDIVLTTYATVAKDYSPGGGMLDHFQWHRLVLDEAHTIRNASSGQFQAAMKLSANIRWCITGTPIQNSIHDLASLFKFLRIPYLEDDRTFRKHIIGQTSVSGAISRQGLENLKLVLGAVCIRRSSLLVAESDVLYKEIRVDLTPIERGGYASIGMSIKKSLDATVSSHKCGGASRMLLRGILKLRQFCNNGGRQICSSSGHGDSMDTLDEKISLLEQSSETTCALCLTSVLVNGEFDPMRLPQLTCCDALICGSCVPQLRSQTSSAGTLEATPCVVCGDDHDGIDYLVEASPNCSIEPLIEPWTTTTSKLHALVTDVIEHHMEEKSIVFTYWISTLDIIESMFQQQAISFRRVDGTLSTMKRAERLSQFHQDSSIRVLIMTLSTGAAGLNGLSVASRLHLVEPQWNPSVEDQAIGRVKRMGQDRQVTVLRYITNDSIEISVQNRQLQKKKLANASGLRAADDNNGQRDRGMYRKELESLLCI
ncbi:hypothetical protein PFICI_05515 [Pestalotiopsis fici W106-1]|uniref:Uncharacterized protein n=1 Tax=Pestalotiopsis fici (strain W106-1 / CGMCC3.15140) TaxID=1229662 RepID=W3XC90_PESFW|nr:uncharacterized protein PFICI_05515 [Pestalotiopsis fici W106-1]ETS83639.1 hypothetical protein PFICI_05515 [Pestalotiopsis fici W106-1]